MKQAVRITGTLEMIRASTRTFALKLVDGCEVSGVLCEGNIASLAELFAENVVVFGVAVYSESGGLLRIDAEGIRKSTEEDAFFRTIPPVQLPRFDLADVLSNQQHKRGLAAIMGKWPGTETGEEIERALREIS
jgi:hypothetical protein